MSSLLQRLAERAHNPAHSRLRPLAAQSFSHWEGSSQSLAEEVELHETARPSHKAGARTPPAGVTPRRDKRTDDDMRDGAEPRASGGPSFQTRSPVSQQHEDGVLVPPASGEERRNPAAPDIDPQPLMTPPRARANELHEPGNDDRGRRMAVPDIDLQPLMPVRRKSTDGVPEQRNGPRRPVDERLHEADRNSSPRRARPSAGGPVTQAAGATSAPEVHIHIGRIEVRSAPAPTPVRRDAAPRPAVPSLDEYLSRRGGGR